MVREVCVLLAVAVRTAAGDDASQPLLEALLLTTSRKGNSSCSRSRRKRAASSFPSAEWRMETGTYDAGKDFKPRPPALC